jgi:hypothetical protein
MHFRETGRRIQLIRTTYDAETKRSKYNVIGAIPRSTLEIAPAVLARLTEDERTELETFIEAQKNGLLIEGKLYAHRLPHVVALIMDYAATTDSAEKDLILSQMLRASLEIQRFVRKQQSLS